MTYQVIWIMNSNFPSVIAKELATEAICIPISDTFYHYDTIIHHHLE